MKKAFFTFVILTVAFATYAQPKAIEATSAFQKTTQPAAIIELPYSQSIVDKAIEDYMSKKAVKGNSIKDYRVYRGVKLNNASETSNDLYIKTEYKSRKEKDITVVYMIVAKITEDVKTRVAPDNSTIAGGADFLNEMAPSIESYNLEVMLKEQEEVVKKNQKKQESLLDDQRDYEKKIKSLEEKIEENKKSQQQQMAELQKQQGILETLKAKRKA